jgi:hypothetical protein
MTVLKRNSRPYLMKMNLRAYAVKSYVAISLVGMERSHLSLMMEVETVSDTLRGHSILT